MLDSLGVEVNACIRMSLARGSLCTEHVCAPRRFPVGVGAGYWWSRDFAAAGRARSREASRLAFVSQWRCFDCQDSRHIVKTCFINDPPRARRGGRRAAFVLGQSKCLRARFDFSRGLVYGSASDRLRARGLFESFAIGSARGAAPNGCWQLALAVSSPQSHRHVALEELIIPRCSGSPSDHLG